MWEFRWCLLVCLGWIMPVLAMDDFSISSSDGEGDSLVNQLFERHESEGPEHFCTKLANGSFYSDIAIPLSNALCASCQLSQEAQDSVGLFCLIPCLARDGSNESFVCLSLLFALGVKLDGYDCSFQTAMHWAAERNDVRLAQLLIRSGASCNELNGDSYGGGSDADERPWQIAARLGHEGVLRVLVEAGVMHKEYEATEAMVRVLMTAASVRDHEDA